MTKIEESEKRKVRNWKLLRRAMVGAVQQTRNCNKGDTRSYAGNFGSGNGKKMEGDDSLDSIQDQDYFHVFDRQIFLFEVILSVNTANPD